MLERIVSGGQTGVDRGALDAALALGFPCGGWCPQGRAAEDDVIPEGYPLTEAPRPGNRERTARNVIDSDGTLILYHGAVTGGTQETLELCLALRRPYHLVDAAAVRHEEAARQAAAFVRERGVRALNVAGPRASGWEGAHAYAEAVVAGVIAAADASGA